MEKLAQGNYEEWCMQMQSVLQIKKLWAHTKEKREAKEDEEKNQDALAYVRLGVAPCQLRHIKDSDNPHDAWETLKLVHRRTGPAY